MNERTPPGIWVAILSIKESAFDGSRISIRGRVEVIDGYTADEMCAFDVGDSGWSLSSVVNIIAEQLTEEVVDNCENDKPEES